MKLRGISAVAAATILAAVTATAAATPGVAAVARVRTAPGPRLSMLAATQTVTADKFKNQPVYVDPDIWVESAGSGLRLDVQRRSYTSPAKVTQLISTPWGTVQHRTLPAWVNDNWNGLKDFIHFSVKNSHGKRVVSQSLTFCPDSYNPERATPSGAATDPYPWQCSSDPFPVGQVWGIARGWAVDPFQQFFGTPLNLGVGKYRVTETVTAPYRKLFGIPAGAATASVRLNVVKVSFAPKRPSVAHLGTSRGQLGSLPHVPMMTRPPKAALPQLRALPSWGISTSTQSHHDYLNFGATVWVGGNSPLDVEGFHVKGSSQLTAYQYFWRNGKVIGRAQVGTMGFDSKPGHNHWHFEQFAQYRLLTAAKKLAVRSEKVGFCIAPTDAVNLLMRGAKWQPSFIGLGGQCGVPGALWVQEYMPVGWGDTYDQFKAGQAFDITNLPNGTYYIEIHANPLHKLYELSKAGNVSLRRVIIGGTKGHRTVRVPAWHGIDKES
jgi:hypothetical protein